LPVELLKEAKLLGFGDEQISRIMQDGDEEDIYEKRKAAGITRVFKMVDTCSAEFEAKTPYFYSTFESPLQTSPNGGGLTNLVNNETIPFSSSTGGGREEAKKKIIVLGSGPNRIGQGIEFDYCCVHGLLALKECGYEAIMVNCNPETVSTDFDMADKLYFEPVYWEHLREIIEHEKPDGVIVQLGGQTALKLSKNLHEKGIPIIGTSFDNMDIAEDRGRFSDLLKEMDIPYPDYGTAWSVDEAIKVANKVGYPVLVRPSYVLGGQRMRIVINDDELEKAVISLLKHIPGNRILVDHFLDRCQEAEIDAICDGEKFHVMGIMEHI
jgi:carbamoyl-phosphate synthase large subunit